MNSLKEGTLLQNGKYKIVRFINSGGFGCTYEGVHTMLDTKVAIKEFFQKDFCNRDEATLHVTIGTESKRGLVKKLQKKFVEEAKILFKELQHPGIVSVKDIFEENGTAYYVMDYIEGSSLHDIVKTQGKLSEDKALKYIHQVCEALEYVHSKNRLHLDIKPGNIMIEKSSDRAILIDFGTSKQYDEADGENTSTLMGKTPGFAPPEQMGNDIVKFYPSTDIYSVGATLYKILTGITPPSATQLISGEKLTPIPSTISAATRNAIVQAMILNKSERPQTVREFLNILQQNKVVENTIIATKPKYNNEETQLTAEIDTSYQPNNTIAGHEYVDLGLPSGLKWATCNVGANTPHEYGDYFAWGETTTKSNYVLDNSRTFGKSMGDISGNASYDAARANWGGTWRLPTKREMEELEDKCTWQWTSQSGVNGCKVTGPNGNSIFLPTAGYCLASENDDIGRGGDYWSSTPNEGNDYSAYYLSFFRDDNHVFWSRRSLGRTVRPVSELKATSKNCFASDLKPQPQPTPTSKSNYTKYILGALVVALGVIVGILIGGNNAVEQEKEEIFVPEEEAVVEVDDIADHGTIVGHDYVDLGLSVKWATCNVGANAPHGYGNYYAWGETTTKSSYDEDNSRTYGESMGDISGNASYDAARANWGSTWRLPTKKEMNELVNKCTWQWTTQSGVEGYKVTGPNGNSIFLPAAGNCNGSSHYGVGKHGYYWSSSSYESNDDSAYCLLFYTGFHDVCWGSRGNGLTVRPVSE